MRRLSCWGRDDAAVEACAEKNDTGSAEVVRLQMASGCRCMAFGRSGTPPTLLQASDAGENVRELSYETARPSLTQNELVASARQDRFGGSSRDDLEMDVESRTGR